MANPVTMALQEISRRANPYVEWGWVFGRLAVIAATLVGLLLLLRESPVFGTVISLLLFAFVYNAAFSVLLARRRVQLVARLGLLFDNAALLVGWWVVASAPRGFVATNDLYLIIFPILVVGAVKLGTVLGTVYTAFWIAWIGWVTVRYYQAGDYELEQLPVRLLFIAVVSGLTLRLITRIERERARAEAATVRFQALYNNMGDAAFIADEGGRITGVNRAGLVLLEAQERDLLQAPLASLLLPEHRAALAEELARALEGTDLLIEAGFLTKSGRVRTADLRGTAIDVAGSRLLFVVARDVTERRQMERRLSQQDRLRSLGQMASGLVHDFKNALSPVLGFSEVLLSKQMRHSQEEQARYLAALRAGAEDALHLVNQLRHFYAEESEDAPFAAVDINATVQDVVFLTQPRWKAQAFEQGKRITVTTSLEAKRRVYGSEADLREALTNLIFNAVDALPNTGDTTLEAYDEGVWSVTAVADTGTGMSEEVQQHCFEPFYTTKGEAGTGMGLFMVYGIVQRHKGSITVESAPGEGTRFVIKLPAVQTELEARSASTPSQG